MSIEELMNEAQKEALELADRLQHTIEEKRMIVTGFMCGFMHGYLLNESHRKTEKSGDIPSSSDWDFDIKN